ncbi:MAG: Preprotein translocase subunit SecG [Candidatus Methanofastidiosum methylothiophilum]|jgi:preprotein translocase subunit Sec61beta|uniref:Preprotein translocase subunit SecG n=1 Tax=Candidatus Methanofastidiosum methylothiophilum TaxID=1705564 RepID=A0A150JD71_9EURY|nr:MAG: Preprotein translocase subunit SecG [Candidatus Methanofastidiosum methylthiophilus]KYC57473.1 MAG: Preprotein translocase subunit SecG [Candidatus Methanofastidiosum methylthiophilus]KYC58259.1 MAG: Preprotein translocase subunit SecG [Candidatus Methanofastidiosum methylthiophilus]OQC51287.1 MAG: Preprotein translocase subunit SecG [Euryarchaeota archaeon ADurb.Bin023]
MNKLFFVGEYMVKRKPQAAGGAMPATGAGLIRYFDEDEGGLKIRPEVVVGLCVVVIVVGILLQIFGAELLGF